MVFSVCIGAFRRYQNKDGSLTPAGKKHYGYGNYDKDTIVLKKGTEVQRVSDVDESGKKRKDGSKHTYVSYTDLDNFKYKQSAHALGGHSFTLESPLGYVSKYELSEDVVIPSLQKQLDVATEHVRSMSMKDIKKHLIDRKGYTESNIYKDPEDFVNDMINTSTEKGETINALRQRAYGHYNRVLMSDKKLRAEYFKRLQEEGYNAVADFNDQKKVLKNGAGKDVNTNGFAESPVIVFDKDKSMKLKSVEKITPDMMAKEADKFASMHDRKALKGAAAGAIVGALAVSPTAIVSPALFALFAFYSVPSGALFGTATHANEADKYKAISKTYKNLMSLRTSDPTQYKAKMMQLIEAANKKSS